MKPKFLKRGIFQRLFGRCATPQPADSECWTCDGDRLEIDLARAPELAQPGGALRLENKGLKQRVLVVHGEDGGYRAFHNRCRHAGRRLDPVPGTETVQCCSVNKSTYGYDGQPVYGPVKEGVHVYDVQSAGGDKLIITLK
jgi:nitrite reductase/ring-hydroxylating ferredoxin subunit